MRQELQAQLNWGFTGSFVNINHHTLELNKVDTAILQKHGIDISNSYHAIVTPNPEKPGHLAGTPRIDVLQNYHANLVLEILGNIESSCTILEDPKRFESAQVNVNALKLMYRLNDFFLGLLTALDKHNLINDKIIRKILNDRNKGRLIFNWLFGVHAVYPHNKVLRMSLDPLLKKEMSSFHQLVQLKNEFMALTSPQAVEGLTEQAIQAHIHEVLKTVIGRLFAEVDKESPNEFITRTKLSYNLIRFMVQHHVQPSALSQEYMRKLRGLADFPKLQAFEAYFMEYSNVLQQAYVKLGQALQRLSDFRLREIYRISLSESRYLVNMDRSRLPWLISTDENKGNHMETPALELDPSLSAIIKPLKLEIEQVSAALEITEDWGVEAQANGLRVAVGVNWIKNRM
ncbi:uncharacterized protein PGTG_21182 [Puccinia graminis f. sp. tritici CRL 75-36-700-3]|uniref:Uncharacterized protein n=1 Tax=Puccinia graminis f. sp. tritici (strain CRL 75-36-700-3 / race SCCL) TaxID=418459 RepID=H6QQH4_PUCGT|nr:uncharacterized protein PGTG_21182 [Puccinia graminis f. sp. tritici CRL 75-36-700-3]EHS62674.1 hypothetical protein PGTG_21182 [Puccinia graminis f. sp. tritici CRL 75-36-700-3]